MKKTLLFLLLIIGITSYSQEKATDVFSAKLGLIGAWVGYEKALSPDFTINGEIGYEGGFFYSSWVSDRVNYVFTTTFSLEGRYYYNFNRRIEKGKNTMNNAANFLAVETDFTPGWATSSSVDNIYVLRTFTVSSKYGFRRNLSNRFNFELATGPGYQWAEGGSEGVILALDVRFGFVF
ncbi:MAG: hypothetical protein GX159_10790 [Flavobacteriaceae bacterium]|jgi:hypothetical protein|nr:hypothetical protein [Flavobacteriaceae bacterium]